MDSQLKQQIIELIEGALVRCDVVLKELGEIKVLLNEEPTLKKAS